MLANCHSEVPGVVDWAVMHGFYGRRPKDRVQKIPSRLSCARQAGESYRYYVMTHTIHQARSLVCVRVLQASREETLCAANGCPREDLGGRILGKSSKASGHLAINLYNSQES